MDSSASLKQSFDNSTQSSSCDFTLGFFIGGPSLFLAGVVALEETGVAVEIIFSNEIILVSPTLGLFSDNPCAWWRRGFDSI